MCVALATQRRGRTSSKATPASRACATSAFMPAMTFAYTTGANAARSASENPQPYSTRSCFRIVDLPLSPAPSSRMRTFCAARARSACTMRSTSRDFCTSTARMLLQPPIAMRTTGARACWRPSCGSRKSCVLAYFEYSVCRGAHKGETCATRSSAPAAQTCVHAELQLSAYPQCQLVTGGATPPQVAPGE